MSSREKIITTARKYAEQGRYDLAIGEYQRLVAAFPDDLRAQIKLGFLHARSGDTGMAVDLWLEVAHSYEQKGGVADAATVLQQVLKLAPDHVDAHLWLAQLLASLEQPAESRRELEVAHELLEQGGRGFEALQVLEDMVALDPGNVAICIRLGEAYAAHDRKDEAVALLTRAVDVLRQAEWVDDFIRVAERLVWLKPDNVALSQELAALYLHQRDPQSALQKLKRCYEADQTDTSTLKLLADTFIDLREPEKGATILRVLADVFEQRGERSRAEAVLDQAYRLDPEFLAGESSAAVLGDDGDGDGDGGGHVDSQDESWSHSGGAQSDPTVLELGEGDWSWQPPAAANAKDLSTLEMSLQPEGPEQDAPRRFLPAVTAEGRHGRLAGSPQHRTVTTQELDFSDLIFLERHRTAVTQVNPIPPPGRGRAARVVTTTELDLADLEEVQPTEPLDEDAMAYDLATEKLTVDTERLPDLSTHEQALSDLEDLAGELSDRYLGPRSEGAEESREVETVKYRHTPPRLGRAPQNRRDGEVGDTRRSRRPLDPLSEPTDPHGRRGGRSGR